MIRCRSFTLLAALALVPASAGASAAPPPVALTATPARVILTGGGRTNVRLTNSGTKRVAVDVSRAGFALDLQGRPRVVDAHTARSAAAWLTFHPTHFSVGPHSSASMAVTATLPREAEPGDHDALALLRTRPLAAGRVAVRLQLGVVVIVRAPGEIVRRLELRRLRVSRRRGATLVEVAVANLGNVTESLQHPRAALSRLKERRVLAAVSAATRELRPHTAGIVAFRLPRTLHGPMTIRVVIPGDGSRERFQRTYWIRL